MGDNDPKGAHADSEDTEGTEAEGDKVPWWRAPHILREEFPEDDGVPTFGVTTTPKN